MIFTNRLTFFFIISILSSQDIPNSLPIYHKNMILLDCGQNWENNTIFGSFRFQQLNENRDEVLNNTNHMSFIGANLNWEASYEVFGLHNVRHKNYYFYLYPRVVSNPEDFDGYSGVPRDIKRIGFSSGETDFSGIGFQNQNIILQIGRGRENWSAGNDIGLVLSYDSPSYDYRKFQYNRKNIRFIYFHGFLESIDNNNRYITGRGIEYTNKKSIVLGFSEVVIYSGLNRPIDYGYINPISTHLEIELNNRQNVIGTENANAIWQISFDNLIKERWRFSNNLIIDELVIDKIQLDSGKVNGIGWSSRLSYSLKRDKNYYVLFGSITSIGTHTFRHGNGYNNFVQRDTPLGWKYGSDGYEYKLGCNYFNSNNIIIKTELGNRLTGSNSIINYYYREYLNNHKKTKFPSGVVNKSSFMKTYVQWDYKSRTTFILTSDYQLNNNRKHQLSVQIGIVTNLLKEI